MKRLNRYLFVFCILPLVSFTEGFGQDLDSLLESHMALKTEYTSASFKATRILNGHSIKGLDEGELDFRISHRFGRINSGAYQFFGLDQAHIHLSLEYGIKDWIMVGLGRGTFEKTVDAFTKIKLLRQSSGKKSRPLSISSMTGIYINGLKWDNPDLGYGFSQRLDFVQQILLARKFSPGLSMQITPSYLHQNLVESEADPKNIFSLGAGARIKLSKRISFNAEYFYLFKPDNETLSTPIYHPLSLGFDIETGGHVFQIVLTNSEGMRENAFLGHTTGSWMKGDIHLGFNVSRIFKLKKTELYE